MKKYIIGYTQGTFDTLHYGHINLLKNAKNQCDFLIVGVNSDFLVASYKKTQTIIKENERRSIIEAIKYVDKVFIVDTLDKMIQYRNFNFDVIFIGDDWKGNDRWKQTEIELGSVGVKVVYLPHTDGISTTIIKTKINNDFKV